jgi:hypothetical protein
MLEVVFNDSEKGSMKWANAATVGESFRDVVCIGCHLDTGDISAVWDREKRKNKSDFEKMLLAARSGEPIRAWKSNAPYSACAFAFVCDVLREIDCNLSVIALPDYFELPDCATWSASNWAQVPASQLHHFWALTHELSMAEKHQFSRLWRILKAENAPLRALVNGSLISVPEDFYDHLILKNIPDGEFHMARLIGTVLGNYALGVGDAWYALRIEKMIADNLLVIVEDNDKSRPYRKILRKP